MGYHKYGVEKMPEEIEVSNLKGPSVDFSFQLNLARDKTEKKIFSYLSEISQKNYQSENKIGLLIVLGIFGCSKSPIVDGMRSLTKEKIDVYLNINFSQFKEEIMEMFQAGNDGAIIINQDGQILAEKIYLTVDNPSLEIPEGTGTRHISGASFSTRHDVLATFTLSEETSVVRIWKDGHYTEQFHPDQRDDE